MIKIENLILGAGISGLAAGQHLRESNLEFLVLEKNDYYGGLCSSFEIEGFTFDYFIHLSFTTNEFVRTYFDRTPQYKHEPNPFNYYHGLWIKHPAINNLFPLSDNEKRRVIEGLKKREKYASVYSDNYEMWLRYQFGDYFAENFPMVYTRKYWAEDAANMETAWIGNRVYQPTMDEIVEGMKTSDTPITYYAKEMRFPKRGGFSEFLRNFVNTDYIHMNEEVITIDFENKTVYTNTNEYKYKRVYSSIPLPELDSRFCGDTSDTALFHEAVSKLRYTSGYIISLGMKGKLSRKDLWDYIYDEDVYVSRLYFPSLMSPSTVPDGCCSVQAEIYTRDGKRYEDENALLEKTINQLQTIGVIEKDKIIVKDIRFVKYCNILFDHNIYDNRDKALGILKKHEIIPIGRFGRWEYLWSDQAFMSGYYAIK